MAAGSDGFITEEVTFPLISEVPEKSTLMVHEMQLNKYSYFWNKLKKWFEMDAAVTNI